MALLSAPAWGRDAWRVDAVVDPSGREATGSFVWTVVADAPLSELQLDLFPEHFAVEPPLDDVLRPRVLPSEFEPGGQAVDSLTWDGVPVRAEAIATGRVRIPLPAVLPAGGVGELRGTFRTRIPLRYGVFGRYRGTVTLDGGLAPLPVAREGVGWLPDALPPATDLVLHLRADGWAAVLAGAGPPSRDVVPAARPLGGTRVDADGIRWSGVARWPTIALRRRQHAEHLPFWQAGEPEAVVSWYGTALRPGQKAAVRATVSAVRETLAGVGLQLPRHLALVEAPLRQRLVELGEGALLVSDRLFEADAPIWRFHDVHLASALLTVALEERAAADGPRFAPLVADGAAWELMDRYLRVRWRRPFDLRQMVSRFSFLPQVDTLLQTPAFPFADQIFDDPYTVDPLGDHVRRWRRPLRTGRMLFLELRDVAGARSLAEATVAWAGGDGPFVAQLAERTGADAAERFAAWLGPVPRRNLALAIERGRDGPWHRTQVEVRQEALAGQIEPRPIEVRLRAGRESIALRWDGRGTQQTWEVLTRRRVGLASVDPRGRVLEIDGDGLPLKRDNRRPQGAVVTGFGYFFALDASGRFEALGTLNVRPREDLRHHAMVRAFANQEVRVGGGFSFAGYFGKPRLGTYLRHRLVPSLELSLLDTRFRPTDAPLLLEGRLTWVYEDRVTAMNPTRGQRVQASLFAGRDIALQGDAARPLADAGFVGFDSHAIKLVPLHAWHVLAMRARLGLMSGDVEHRQFSLGGATEVRGVPAGYRVGRFRTSAALEWRHDFFRDADLPWPIYRPRGIQGSLFLEAGLVAEDLRKGPTREDVAVGVGYGLRFFVDWFGVFPGMFGVDVAWSPGMPDGRFPIFAAPSQWPHVPVQVFLVGTQSF